MGLSIRLSNGAFEVVGLSMPDLNQLRTAGLELAQWQELFAVHVVQGENRPQPAMLGSHAIVDGVLRFQPRFPLTPGVTYRAVLRPSRLPGHPAASDIRAEFALPKPKPDQLTEVAAVYPTRDRLPENQLKFYIHFSAPMSRGEAYDHIHLLDATGKPVADPFLELGEELWDPAGKRFTLFFDPGRIKRGLKPREEVGPALEEGKSYTLVIDRRWADAQGFPLKESYRKPFRVLAPDDTPPDPKNWRIAVPAAGGDAPLQVTFPEALDEALLQRLLWVTDPQGQHVAGRVQVRDEETVWHFLPERPWLPGRYHLVVDTTLEDLAGNSVGRPFEVDLFQPIRKEIEKSTVELPFEVK
ncbi:MAG: Ig-like domain-containing protein [Gemmataceae bacterium]